MGIHKYTMENYMKHGAKRILPILLILVILASLAWYLLIYDVDFTRDALVQSARFFDHQGNHSVAAKLYDLAYIQSGGDADVAIELAEQFKESGNYTKAEVTLSKAIANGGSAKLYIALCQTYVQQDKLLDAVTMLDNIADPAIREEIYAQRPAAPTASPEPNYYNQYINVTVTSQGDLYLRTDGQYPSIQDEPSTGNLTLQGGETVIYAVSVGENGLVSPLSILGYTISGVIEAVEFSDPTIEALVREQLQISGEEPIYTNDLWPITSFTIPEGAENYEDLSYLPYLQTLTIQGSNAESLAPLSNLRHLTELIITNSQVQNTDLLTIAGLPGLQKLTLRNCGLSSIENLQSATNLQYLDLGSNSIRNVSALSFMKNLTSLNLSNNALTSLNSLSSLTGLQALDVSYNSLVSILPISGCTQLTMLNISNNSVVTLSGMEKMTGLTELDLSSNRLSDVSTLSVCVGMQQLDIADNHLTDISALSPLTKLEYLDFSRNQVTTLPTWSVDCALVHIDGSNNQLVTIASLAGFEYLNYVYMDYNQITSVDALASCHDLIKVSVYGNPVTDVSALTDMSVIVNYNPLG